MCSRFREIVVFNKQVIRLKNIWTLDFWNFSRNRAPVHFPAGAQPPRRVSHKSPFGACAMCCCDDNPDLPSEVRQVKKIMGGELVVSVLSCLLYGMPLGFVGGIGGLVGIFGSSVIVCCGPRAKGEGVGKMRIAAVLMTLAAMLHLAGLGLIIYAYHTASVILNRQCEQNKEAILQRGIESCDDYIAAVLGFTTMFVVPSAVLSVVALILDIAAAVCSQRAKRVTEILIEQAAPVHV